MQSIMGDCPLGATCEEVVILDSGETALKVCPWYVRMRGKDPQSEDQYDDWRCAIHWMPILQTEHSMFERQTGAAVESLRNNMIKQAGLTRDANKSNIPATK